MGSITLIRLTLFNFRSFRGLHTVTFPAKGLVILRGENRDTRGDSGAGKSNVLLAIAYLFGYCRHSAKALQSWLDEDDMYVEVELETPAGLVTVRRGIKGISIGKLKGKAAETALDKLVGVPTELREILTYRDQVKPKKFLDMRDTALKKFLTQVLQLHGLEAEIEAAEALLKELDKKKETASIFLFNSKQELQRREEEVISFTPESTTDLEAELGRLHVAYDVMKNDLSRGDMKMSSLQQDEQADAADLADEFVARAAILTTEAEKIKRQPLPSQEISATVAPMKEKLKQADVFMAQLEAADKLAWRAYEDETSLARNRARFLHNEMARIPGIADNVHRLTSEIEKLEQDLCDRCGRQWDNAKAALVDHQHQLASTTRDLDMVRSHQDEVKKLDEWISSRSYVHDPRLAKLDTVRQTLKDQISAEQRRLDLEEAKVYSERQAQAQALLHQAALARSQAQQMRADYLRAPERLSRLLAASQEALRGSAAEASTKLAELNGKLNLVRQANRAGLLNHNQQIDHLAKAQTRYSAARVEAQVAEENWKTQSDYVDLLKGFRNKIFDEVLESISADATAIVGTLPNSQHISVEFRSEKETLKGTVQERITPVTYLHGEERDLEEAVSGGQLTSIGLAVDLAVAGVISQRLGCNLNWMTLDESFEGHDTITKGSCLEMLQTYAANKLVIIVDHASETKEMFTQSITVIHENKASRFQ